MQMLSRMARLPGSGSRASVGSFADIWQILEQSRNVLSCRHLPVCGHDGIVEMVARKLLPTSKVHALMFDKKTICVDERWLTEQQLSAVGTDGYVCTGTFWIRCEKLAELFGVDCDDLNRPWDQVAWKDKVGMNLPADHAILTRSDDMVFALTVPLWEVIRPLDLEFGKVGADRVPEAK